MAGTLRDRIGVDVGNRMPIEEAIQWASRNDVHVIDVQIDRPPNALDSFDAGRCSRVKALARREGVTVGLHTSSAVNVAEFAPCVDEAVDEYLRNYVDMGALMEAGWIVVHAGFHFTSDRDARMKAALDRLQRIADHAERQGVTLLLENLNPEPEHAEVKYLAHTRDEWRYFYDGVRSPALRLSFTANHPHLLDEGIDPWLDTLPVDRVDEVRLADSHGRYEEHLLPGQGTMDFGHIFRRLEEMGYRGHYVNAFGTLDDMLAGREFEIERAREAGVSID